MLSLIGCVVFLYFKEKTAYEMVSCDWSSDVCSSDLRLASAAGAGQRQQTNVRAPQHFADRAQLALATDETRAFEGKIQRPLARRAQRREVALQAGIEELVEPLRLGQALQ